MLEREKMGLQNQLRDIEWRIDQESKAYHKANEERKNHNLELNLTKHNIKDLSNKTRAALSHDDDNQFSSRSNQSVNTRNIPPDQRILDPKKGPIKKTAAVKSLPRLESDDYYR